MGEVTYTFTGKSNKKYEFNCYPRNTPMMNKKAVYILAAIKFTFDENSNIKGYIYQPLLVRNSYEMGKYPGRYLLTNGIDDDQGSAVLCVYEVGTDQEMDIVKQDLIHLSYYDYAPEAKLENQESFQQH